MAKSILEFVPRPAKRTVELPSDELVRYSLVPLGAEDVILSVPTFEVVLYVLANGSEEDRKELAVVLRRMYQGPFVARV